MLAELGLTVARQIPLEMIPGLLTGAYSVHGGVIRDAGGRIVMHLVSSSSSALAGLVPGMGVISDMIQNAQMWQLTNDVAKVQSAVEAVLNVSSAGIMLSGLGMVTSIAGFAYLNRRLGQVDEKLAVIERDVKDIKEWLAGLQKSKLHFAIDNIRHAENSKSKPLRRDLLLQSKRDFSTLTHQYREQWTRARGVLEIAMIDDLYTLAILGHATVCSNLGLGAEAALDLRANYADWASQARRHAKAMLLDDRPERLLAAQYVSVLPVRTLVELMDFAHESDRGFDWIDELRIGPTKKGTMLEFLPTLPSQLRQLGGGNAPPTDVVDAAKTLCARSAVMEANVAHYDFLEKNQLNATGSSVSLRSPGKRPTPKQFVSTQWMLIVSRSLAPHSNSPRSSPQTASYQPKTFMMASIIPSIP